MTDPVDHSEKAPTPDKSGSMVSPELLRTGGWVAAASMGIGSAALVAALLYANRPAKPGAKSE